MKILVTGATGLIGSAICARLIQDGHVLRRVSRHPPSLNGWIRLDMAKAVEPEQWLPHLAGIDAVINCAGVLQDGPGEDTNAVHNRGAEALFEACARSGVRKVIHFSAIGVDRERPSQFSATKFAGDQALMALDLDWVILRPSVVLGRNVFGASALIRGLAALPLSLSMPETGKLQMVRLEDVVETIRFFLSPSAPAKLTLDLAGPDAMTMSEIVERTRAWLGWRPAWRMDVPQWLADLLYRSADWAGKLGWRPPMRSTAKLEMVRGATGDPARWTEITGITPQSMQSALAANPAGVADRWFAGLYILKPLIFLVLPFFWIATGIISLTVGYQLGVDLLLVAGLGALSYPAVIAGAVADLVTGALLSYRRTTRLGIWCALALSFFYAISGTILRPDLWSEPLGPFLKIFPIIVLHLVALAILEER